VPPFENAVLNMEPGNYAGPVQTQFGYHLILLRDRRVMAPPSLEEMRGELEVELQNAGCRGTSAQLNGWRGCHPCQAMVLIPLCCQPWISDTMTKISPLAPGQFSRAADH
jgi:hypothetical protein